MSQTNHSERAVKLSEPINKVVAGLGHKRSFLGWQVVERWPEIAGEKIAKVTRAERYDNGILFIRARNAAWAESLDKEQELLLEAIGRIIGGGVVERIHFR